MNKIIITGINGYISNSIKKHFELKNNIKKDIKLLDVRGTEWGNYDFSKVDTVIHCAALVHKDSSKHTLDEYIAVNTILTEKIAQKAKREGVRYFIFFSTEGVYGTTGSLFKDIVLDTNTELKPIEKYEISKKMAEDRIMALKDDNFKVAIIRPPFVYGKDCPGNYRRLREAVLKFRFIPTIKNKKSMIYIENLCEFVYQLWRRKLGGTFLPQDLPYRCTTDMCLEIAKFHKRRICYTSILNLVIKFLSIYMRSLRVAFGNEYYKEELSNFNFNYQLVNFRESIIQTEMRNK